MSLNNDATRIVYKTTKRKEGTSTMSERSKVKVTPVKRSEPNVRKLARALIAMARKELEAEALAKQNERGAA